MGSTARPVLSKLGMQTPYAPRVMSGAWVAAGWAGAGYGIFLTATALRSPPGADLTGHWVAQPAFKASMAVLLAVGAAAHPVARERRWLVPALLFSATGDWLLAIPWWAPSFVLGLSAFLLAHVCYLGVLIPLARRSARSGPRWVAVAAVGVAGAVLLVWFWPQLGRQGLKLPVTVYLLVLGAMVGAALLARLPTKWTAAGAVCFAASDAMLGIERFVLADQALELPVWWTYAGAQILITAGLFFSRGRSAASVPSAKPH